MLRLPAENGIRDADAVEHSANRPASPVARDPKPLSSPATIRKKDLIMATVYRYPLTGTFVGVVSRAAPGDDSPSVPEVLCAEQHEENCKSLKVSQS